MKQRVRRRRWFRWDRHGMLVTHTLIFTAAAGFAAITRSVGGALVFAVLGPLFGAAFLMAWPYDRPERIGRREVFTQKNRETPTLVTKFARDEVTGVRVACEPHSGRKLIGVETTLTGNRTAQFATTVRVWDTDDDYTRVENDARRIADILGVPVTEPRGTKPRRNPPAKQPGRSTEQ